MRNISAKKLKKLGGKVPFSSITGPKKPIPKSNPRQQAKRKAGYRKLLSGKEYKAARAEAMKRAEYRCEYEAMFCTPTYTITGFPNGYEKTRMRCGDDDGLHAHHLRYPKSRPLTASDLKILCKPHHEMAEAAKMHKTRMF